jgi:hypothetical protein
MTIRARYTRDKQLFPLAVESKSSQIVARMCQPRKGCWTVPHQHSIDSWPRRCQNIVVQPSLSYLRPVFLSTQTLFQATIFPFCIPKIILAPSLPRVAELNLTSAQSWQMPYPDLGMRGSPHHFQCIVIQGPFE